MTDYGSILESLPDRIRCAADCEIARLQGGRNNQVYVYRSADGVKRILKAYNSGTVGESTRLEREFSFLRVLWEGGIRKVPEPVYADIDRNFGIYSFLEGDRIDEHWAEPWAVVEAAEFIAACQSLRGTPLAAACPGASEACFSLEAHARMLETRLNRLERMEPGDDLQLAARRFFVDDLGPTAIEAISRLRAAPGGGSELRPENRWLSPSDFGFHNALKQGESSLAFLDFEHAGWDDPAKLIIDFCHQPDHVLERELAATFETMAVAIDPKPEALVARVRLLRPVYQLKWACILLNEFLPFGAGRRKFLGLQNDSDAAAEKERQLERARQMARNALTELKTASI